MGKILDVFVTGQSHMWVYRCVCVCVCVCTNFPPDMRSVCVCEHVNMWLVWLPACYVCKGQHRSPSEIKGRMWSAFVYLDSSSASLNQWKYNFKTAKTTLTMDRAVVSIVECRGTHGGGSGGRGSYTDR